MTKAATALMAAVLALGVFSGPSAAQPFAYPPKPVAWIVGPGFFGFSGYPWPGPPVDTPIPTPAYGCYFTTARVKDAWRRVEVCS